MLSEIRVEMLLCTKYPDYNKLAKVRISFVVYLSPEGVGC